MKAYDSAKASAISVADATIKKEILAEQVEKLYVLWPGPATTAPLRPPD